MPSCPTCSKKVDPLRAYRVVLHQESFVYLCDERCERIYASLDGAGHSASLARNVEKGALAAETVPSLIAQGGVLTAALEDELGNTPVGPLAKQARSIASSPPMAAESGHHGGEQPGSDRPSALVAPCDRIALLGGTLTVFLALLGQGGGVTWMRLGAASVGLIALVVRYASSKRAGAPLHPIFFLAPCALGLLLAALATWVQDPAADVALHFCGLCVAAAAMSASMVTRERGSFPEGLPTEWVISEQASVSRCGVALASFGAAAASLLAGLAAFATHRTATEIVLSALSGFVALSTESVGRLSSLHVARGLFAAAERGIYFRAPRDWEQAADVDLVAFCARGTLLLGEPELSELHPLGAMDETSLLGLLAGAELTAQHPVALSVQRAARARGVAADAVRSPSVHPGLGVTAVASSGLPLVVGSRALMLREKISVAAAEQEIAAIEGHGRTVLLAALGGKLVGVAGLQDGLRPGARAAVQHLLDAQVEPVLFSGDSRETCEAIARALDIDHIRPEVLPGDRALEIERLRQGGLVVAVVGHPQTDESPLSAADVAVALAVPPSSKRSFAITLSSDDVRDGALAISLARKTRSRAKTSLILAVAPGLTAAVGVAFGVLSAGLSPLCALIGSASAALFAKATDLAGERGRMKIEPGMT